jgi:aminopeptidase N
VKDNSIRWFRYPYPQLSIVNIGFGAQALSTITVLGGHTDDYYTRARHVVAHEVSHQWAGMLVCADVVSHRWLTEGIAEFLATDFSDTDGVDRSMRFRFMLRLVEQAMRGKQVWSVYGGEGGVDGPIDGAQNGFLTYGKAMVALDILRHDVLGPEMFDRALRTYIERWVYKHPTTADFCRTIENVSSRKLDWFWREFLFEAPKFDQAIGAVQQTTTGDTTRVVITYVNRERGVLPIHARVTLSDGTTQDVVYPATVWQAGPKYTVTYAFAKRTVTWVELDPEQLSIDIDRSNNVWMAP